MLRQMVPDGVNPLPVASGKVGIIRLRGGKIAEQAGEEKEVLAVGFRVRIKWKIGRGHRAQTGEQLVKRFHLLVIGGPVEIDIRGNCPNL